MNMQKLSVVIKKYKTWQKYETVGYVIVILF